VHFGGGYAEIWFIHAFCDSNNEITRMQQEEN